jgi:hypothetical protein
LNAALDISGGRLALRELSRGRADPARYFSSFDVGSAPLGSHRNLGDKLMSVLDDHDHVYGEKLRFATAVRQMIMKLLPPQQFSC